MTLWRDMQGSLRFMRFSLPALGTWLHGYVLVLWLAASGILVLLVSAGHRIGSIWPLIALGLLGAVAERSRVRFSENLELSISLVPSLFAAVTFGPLEAMLIGAASLLGDLRR